MKLSIIIFTTAILFLPLTAIGQKENIVIIGKVVDNFGEPIESAHVLSKSNYNGVITDKRGIFKLHANRTYDIVIVSHIGYNTKKQKVSFEGIYDDTAFIEINLKIKHNLIGEVEIIENKRWQVVKPNRIWVYDYELYGLDKMLLLLKDTIKYELRYLNVSNNTVCKISIKNNSFCKLFKDGLRNTHLALTDSIYQIFICDKQISFYKGISKKEYRDMILPIVAKTDNIFVVKELSLNNQKLVYYSIDRNTQKKALITEIFYQEKYKNSLEVKKQQMSYFGINYMGEITIEELHIQRLYFQWGQYFESIAIQPFYSPLIQFGECFCVFDLVNGLMFFYNQDGKLIKKQEISFHKSKKVYSIQVDKATGKFYSLWKKHGIVQVDNINMQTGEVAKTYCLANYLNPEKVQFRNGYIYFLYSNFNFNKKLFKMPISQLPNQ